MSLWIQHLLVLLIVGACLVYALRGFLRTFAGKKGIGNCCSKGCAMKTDQARSSPERAVFVPVEMLTRRNRK